MSHSFQLSGSTKTLDSRLSLWLIGGVVALSMLVATSGAAGVSVPEPRIPPDGGCEQILLGYESPSQVHLIFSSIDMSAAIHYCFNNLVESQSGTDSIENFDSIVRANIDFGAGVEEIELTGPVQVRTTDHWGVTTGTFDTEMESMDLAGLAGGGLIVVEVRESPSVASTGEVTVTADGTGFQIDSSFELFFEMRINEGAWIPADAPVTVELVQLANDTPALGNVALVALAGSLAVAGVLLRRRARPAVS